MKVVINGITYKRKKGKRCAGCAAKHDSVLCVDLPNECVDNDIVWKCKKGSKQ